MLIFGASGHAKVIIDCLVSQSISIDGIFDDDISKINLLGFPVLGAYDELFLPEIPVIIAIGDNSIREKLSSQIKHQYGTAIHKSSNVSPYSNIGCGSVLMHNTVVQSGTSIGKHCIINTSATVDHDCILGNFVHIAPNAVLCGGISIGDKTLVGAGATIIPNISVGKNVIIGAGSIITKNIPDDSRVFPARSIIYE
jgi:sugar O-acyltransferase (sialic acid O-acetyltransferase NeuD family)